MTTPYIVAPRVQHELAHHHEEGRPGAFEDRLVWMSADQVPEASLFVSTRSVRDLADGEGDEGTDLHTHGVPQLYLLLSDDRSLRVEALIDGEVSLAVSPAAIYIPAGIEHRLRIVAGTGTVVAILAAGVYG